MESRRSKKPERRHSCAQASPACLTFDAVFAGDDIQIIRTPIRAPRAKGLASHCTSCGRFERGSAVESAALVLDQAWVGGVGWLVEPPVLVVGLVGDEQPGLVPGLDR